MIILWHSKDLRIEENKALTEASLCKEPLCPLFIFEESPEITTASSWWLYESLKSLQQDYAKKDMKLIFRIGNPLTILKELISNHKVTQIFTTIDFERENYQKLKRIQSEIEKLGVTFHLINSGYLIDHDIFLNKKGKPYLKFAPFWKEAKKTIVVEKHIPLKPLIPTQEIHSQRLERILPSHPHPWTQKLKRHCFPGRAAALRKLKNFATKVKKYEKNRDYPGIEGTSRLSPYLHFGELSPFEVWKVIANKGAKVLPYLRELVFREFSAHFLFHFKEASHLNFDKRFNHFPWSHSQKHLELWQKGMTGFPLVDAGMRQLWQTGWMHNRMRMVVASFLTKDLFIHWTKGAEWFLETLVDADLANNAFNWQWVAGTGLDAAPYFRIFNPLLQSKKFDKEGKYIKTYIPELAHLDKKWIHTPHLAPREVLEKAGIILGETYPLPIVSHEEARKKALETFKKLQKIKV